MKGKNLLKSHKIYGRMFIIPLSVLIFCFSFSTRSTSMTDKATFAITNAVQNLQVDPRGRVVDVTFDSPVALSFPDDNSRFEVDIARPLGRDISLSVGDLNGDGIPDLFGKAFSGATHFYPGLDSHPFRFGEGQFVGLEDWSQCPYKGIGSSGDWEGSGMADFDGDGVKDIVVGDMIYTMVNPDDPTLLREAHDLQSGFVFDIFPSVGDLDGDGKPDIITTGGYTLKAYLHRNQSTPGNFSFQKELLTDHHLSSSSPYAAHGLPIADVNNDGLLDLFCWDGVYFNQGTQFNPVFDFGNPTTYTVNEGPWVDGIESDQAISIFICDGDGDGLVDAYISNYGTSIWQGSFYKNVGTPSSPAFQFQSPILCWSTPYDNSYRGHDEPSFSPNSIYISTADVNRDGLVDILVSDSRGSFSNPTVLWNRSSGDSDPHFSYMDIYTFFTDGYPKMNPYWSFFSSPNWLPYLPIAWKDYTGDGLEDIIRINGFMYYNRGLEFFEREADYPIRFSDGQFMQTVTGADIIRIGLAELDLDNDGVIDFICGMEDGQLAYYRNQGNNSNLIIADPVALTDTFGSPISVGENSWPTEFDWDDDGDFDLLVGEQTGKIFILENQGGQFNVIGNLSAEGWDPLDLTPGVVGGGVLSPSLDAVDFNGDNLVDVLGGGHSPPCIWYFKNTGTSSSPSFSTNVISVDRTIPGHVEKLSDYSYRLYFGIPVLPGETSVFFHENLDENQPAVRQISTASEIITISGRVTYDGEGLPGVTLAFSNGGGETTTNTNGEYSQTVDYGWSGTVTPTKTGYSFFPESRTYPFLTYDQIDQDYTADLLTYTLTTSANPSNGGTITKDPDKVSYDHGESVELTAYSDTGYAFIGWSGDVPSGHENDNPVTLYMDADKTVTANFVIFLPEIDIKQDTSAIPDGGSYDFGSHLAGTDTNVAFTIENTGAAELILSGSPIITIAGTDADQFSVQQQPASSIASESSTTFIIRFSPSSTGFKEASVSIANNDGDENPYDITLEGTGVVTGSLTVTIEPQGAIEAGAQWKRLCTTTWYDSGYEESGLLEGSVIVEFKDIPAWLKPANQIVSITTGDTSELSGVYTQLFAAGNFIDSGQSLESNSGFEVKFGDVDGDGDLDAFVANQHGNKVWLNDGSGTFTNSGQSLGDEYSRGIGLGDLDADGDLDAFVTNWGSGNKAVSYTHLTLPTSDLV